MPHLDNTNQDMLKNGWLPLLLMLVQGEHRRYSITATLDPRGGKQNKNGRFLEGKPAWSLWCEELLLADWPAGTTPALECLELTWEGTLAVLQHDGTWSKLGAQKPWSTFLRLGCRLDLEQYTWNTSVSPSMLGPISVVVEEKPGGLFFFFLGGETTSKGVMLLFWTNGKKYGRGRIKELGKNLLRGE